MRVRRPLLPPVFGWRGVASSSRWTRTFENDPAEIPALVDALDAAGASAVVGYRVDRRDSPWRRLQSRVANLVRNRLTGESIRDTGCSLKVFRKEALGTVTLYDDMHRFLPTLVRLHGGTVLERPVRHRSRRFGQTQVRRAMCNRAGRAFVDALGVRWLQRRRLRYEVKEDLP